MEKHTIHTLKFLREEKHFFIAWSLATNDFRQNGMRASYLQQMFIIQS